MLLIRDVRAADLDGVHAVAAHLDSVNLPDDRARLADLIAASEASFSGRCEVADRRFVFVLVDPASGRVLGTSMVFAQHGSRRAPHVYFDVLEEERYSATLDIHFVHRVLRIGYNYKGLTEIGGLVLDPAVRGRPDRLGVLLSYVRFLYIARHRAMFMAEVISELMPPLQPDGTSLLWEALGRRFTGLSYQEADRLSHENKEFIRALFPEEPIYATLLPPGVQELIGQVGPETKGVEKMLRRIGFEYAQRIDPFDGGPHFHARIDDVALVRAARAVRVAGAAPARAAEVDETDQTVSGTRGQGHGGSGGDGGGGAAAGAPRLLVAAEGDTAAATGAQAGYFRAVALEAPAPPRGGALALPAEAQRLLGVAPGDEVMCLPLDSPWT